MGTSISGRRLALVAVIVLGAYGVEAGFLRAAPSAERGKIGTRAPELPQSQKSWLVGPSFRLATLREGPWGDGTPVVVNFWAASCGECKSEGLQLARFRANMSGRAKLVGVAFGKDASTARRWARSHRVGWPIVHDPRGELRREYGRDKVPTTYVIDRMGQIAEVIDGPVTYLRLRQAIETIEYQTVE